MASIQKRPDGRWRARYRDDVGKEHARHFPRKIDAQRWLDEVTTSVVTGAYVDPKLGKDTLNSFYAEWSQRQIWAAGTTKAMSLAVRSCTFGDVEFRNLKRSHVETWVKKMSVDGLAPGTVKTRYNNVRSVLRGARGDNMLATDPADGVTLPRARKSEHAMVIPSPGDMGKLRAAADIQFRPFVAMCAFAGLRLVRPQRCSSLTLTSSGGHRKSSARYNGRARGEVNITPPKYGSERVVNIPDVLVQMLAHHVEHIGLYSVHQWLFIGDGGLPPH